MEIIMIIARWSRTGEGKEVDQQEGDADHHDHCLDVVEQERDQQEMSREESKIIMALVNQGLVE
jgi:hypothetical protein